MRARDDDGQILVLFAVGLLVALLGIAGLVLDVGHAYLVKRQLQAAADAAAIAGADALPTVSSARAAAVTYGSNGDNPVGNASQTATGYCLRSVTYCYGQTPGTQVTSDSGQANGLVVKESANVSTTFLKLFGVSSLSVAAQATACGLCASVPLNIVLVVDRTRSMDVSHSMPALKDGIDTFLASLNPTLDYVSLLVLPPSTDGSDCSDVGDDAFPFYGSSYPTKADGGYAVVHYSHDYLSGGELNPSSRLVQQVDCMESEGGTAYKQALVAAKQELDNVPSDRKSYTNVIVFETDGAANTAPDSFFDHSGVSKSYDFDGWGDRNVYTAFSGHADDVNRPCGSALDYANNTLKPAGIVLMTVGYAVDSDGGCYQAPHLVVTTTTHKNRYGKTITTTTYSGVGYEDQPEGTSAGSTLAGMASPGDNFPASSQSALSTSFATIAGKLVGAKLVPDGEAP